MTQRSLDQIYAPFLEKMLIILYENITRLKNLANHVVSVER